MGFFSRRLLDRDSEEWLLATFGWLLQNFGGYEDHPELDLVEPTEESFPLADLTDEELPHRVFDQVRHFAGLAHWPCRLQAQAHRPQVQLHPGVATQQDGPSPVGTFRLPPGSDGGPIITFQPELVSRPENLVATFAHELAHYLLLTAVEPPPGGAEAVEVATDLCTIYLGFGIFTANAAFEFEKFSDGMYEGWSMRQEGYLSEEQIAYGLGIFAKLREIPAERITSWLKPNPQGYFKRALKDLRKRTQELADLRDLADAPPVPNAELVRSYLTGLERLKGELPAGALLANRVAARCLLGDAEAAEKDVVARQAAGRAHPGDSELALLHRAGLAATDLLLGQSADETARAALESLQSSMEKGTDDLEDEYLELGLALTRLVGDDDLWRDLWELRQRRPFEPGFEMITAEVLQLCAAPQDPPDLEPVIWSAVRGWIVELVLHDGRASSLFVLLLGGLLRERSQGELARVLAGRLAELDQRVYQLGGDEVSPRFQLQPLRLEPGTGEAGEQLLTMIVAVEGEGTLHGDTEFAEELTSELAAVVPGLAALHPGPEINLLDPDTRLDVVLQLPDGAQLAPRDLQCLTHRFRVAALHARRTLERFPRPGEVRTEPLPSEPGD